MGGQAILLKAFLDEAANASSVEGASKAREAVAQAVAAAEQVGNLTLDEAAQMRQMLELEINMEFGARHEDTALGDYATRVGSQVYGEQERVKIPMPPGGPHEALLHAFPNPTDRCKAAMVGAGRA